MSAAGRGARGTRKTSKPGRPRPRATRKPRGVTAPVAGLSHVAIATPSADALAAILAAALGAERGAEEMIDEGALRVLFVHLGTLTLELLEPRGWDHTVARVLGKRGPGLHHLSLEVADLEGVLERCRVAGIEAVDASPRPGAHGTRVAFLHPKSLGGVLIELCERPRTARRPR